MKKQEKLALLIEGLELLRDELGSNVQVQTILTLLYVAQHGEVSVYEMGKMLGNTTASASRNISFLGKIWKHGRPGLQLFDEIEDRYDRRHKSAKLSRKGEKVVNRLLGG
jgi:DNA-binding MarR family transcriptional regulator